MSLIGGGKKEQVSKAQELRDPEQILAYLEELARTNSAVHVWPTPDAIVPVDGVVKEVTDTKGQFVIGLKRAIPGDYGPKHMMSMSFGMDGRRFLARMRWIGRDGYMRAAYRVPEAIVEENRRGKVRVKFSPREPARVTAIAGFFAGTGVIGRIVNLSLDGVCLRVDRAINVKDQKPLPIGPSLFRAGEVLDILRLQDLPQCPMVECSGTVCHIQRDTTGVLIGIRFERMGAAELKAIETVVNRKSSGAPKDFPKKARRGEVAHTTDPTGGLRPQEAGRAAAGATEVDEADEGWGDLSDAEVGSIAVATESQEVLPEVVPDAVDAVAVAVEAPSAEGAGSGEDVPDLSEFSDLVATIEAEREANSVAEADSSKGIEAPMGERSEPEPEPELGPGNEPEPEPEVATPVVAISSATVLLDRRLPDVLPTPAVSAKPKPRCVEDLKALVFVVDDTECARIAKELREAGFGLVAGVRNFMGALAEIRKGLEFDALVIDWQLGVSTATAAIQRLREHGLAKDCRVVLLAEEPTMKSMLAAKGMGACMLPTPVKGGAIGKMVPKLVGVVPGCAGGAAKNCGECAGGKVEIRRKPADEGISRNQEPSVATTQSQSPSECSYKAPIEPQEIDHLELPDGDVTEGWAVIKPHFAVFARTHPLESVDLALRVAEAGIGWELCRELEGASAGVSTPPNPSADAKLRARIAILERICLEGRMSAGSRLLIAGFMASDCSYTARYAAAVRSTIGSH